MPNMLVDGVSLMMTTLLAQAGTVCTYSRGASSISVTMYKAEQPSQVVDSGNGLVTEIIVVDFHAKPADITFGDPATGDLIVTGGKTYKVLPLVSDKPFFKVSDYKIRIHTKRVA